MIITSLYSLWIRNPITHVCFLPRKISVVVLFTNFFQTQRKCASWETILRVGLHHFTQIRKGSRQKEKQFGLFQTPMYQNKKISQESWTHIETMTWLQYGNKSVYWKCLKTKRNWKSQVCQAINLIKHSSAFAAFELCARRFEYDWNEFWKITAYWEWF